MSRRNLSCATALTSCIQVIGSLPQRKLEDANGSDVQFDNYTALSLVTSNDEHTSSDGALYVASSILHLPLNLPRRRSVSS